MFSFLLKACSSHEREFKILMQSHFLLVDRLLRNYSQFLCNEGLRLNIFASLDRAVLHLA